MKLLEIRPPVQVRRREGHEIHVVRHDLRQFVPIMLSPGVTEGLRELAYSFLVCFRLRVYPHGKEKKQQSAPSAFHLHSSNAAQKGKQTGENRFRVAILTRRQEFHNFFLALAKICAYIRICRRAPRPREIKSSSGVERSRQFSLGANVFRQTR
jgi:hypothetical protein